jgi:putative NIF3 family GTP cyclohydrolase 1 type 2
MEGIPHNIDARFCENMSARRTNCGHYKSEKIIVKVRYKKTVHELNFSEIVIRGRKIANQTNLYWVCC